MVERVQHGTEGLGLALAQSTFHPSSQQIAVPKDVCSCQSPWWFDVHLSGLARAMVYQRGEKRYIYHIGDGGT